MKFTIHISEFTYQQLLIIKLLLSKLNNFSKLEMITSRIWRVDVIFYLLIDRRGYKINWKWMSQTLYYLGELIKQIQFWIIVIKLWYSVPLKNQFAWCIIKIWVQQSSLIFLSLERISNKETSESEIGSIRRTLVLKQRRWSNI